MQFQITFLPVLSEGEKVNPFWVVCTLNLTFESERQIKRTKETKIRIALWFEHVCTILKGFDSKALVIVPIAKMCKKIGSQ